MLKVVVEYYRPERRILFKTLFFNAQEQKKQSLVKQYNI